MSRDGIADGTVSGSKTESEAKPADETGRTSGVSALEFGPILLANLLPIVGVVWLDWRLNEIVLVYWIELLVMILTYAGAALFAQQPVILEGRRSFLPGFSEETELCDARWGDNPRVVQLGKSLPPIYPRNFAVIRPSLLWALGFILVVPFALEYTSQFEAAFSLSIVGVALAILASHLVQFYRDFFRTRAYERTSAYMLLEVPCRLLAFAFGLVMVLLVTGGFMLIIATGIARETFGMEVYPNEALLEMVVGMGLILGKIVVEWSTFRAEREADPSGFATWFTPYDPRES